MKPRAVIAGIAGNGSSTLVVESAAGEARRRGRPLRIVHVIEWNSGGTRATDGGSYVEQMWSGAAAMINAAAQRAQHHAPELEIRTDTLVGHPAARLLELAEEAEVIVLGHRGSGGFAGIRLGSVSRRVAAHAACPVTVVRGGTHPDGPVIAGIDDSPAAGHVLDTAFSAAAARAARLVVVREIAPVMRLRPVSDRPAGVAASDRNDAELARIQHRLTAWRDRFPQVPVEVRLTHEGIASVLVGASADGQLVIVGSHGRDALRGALLGSTGWHLLEHAECPVLVTRPRV